MLKLVAVGGSGLHPMSFSYCVLMDAEESSVLPYKLVSLDAVSELLLGLLLTLTPAAETCLVNNDHMCNNQHLALSCLGSILNGMIEIKKILLGREFSSVRNVMEKH